jgi:predicted NAD/FAD-dependent oxidoreductase
MRAAVVGAGVSGLVLARTLRDAGCEVAVFDKGRTVGGRVATRRREQGAFDHGAQRFSARGEAFRAAVEDWERAGVVARTESASDEPWWVPQPDANALARALAAGLEVRVSTRVTSLRRVNHAWRLALEGGGDPGPFDVVLLTAPVPQSAALLAPHGVFTEALARVHYAPTWALLLLCDAAGVAWPARTFTPGRDGDAISLLVREGGKPGRPPDDALMRLVVHATSAFSLAHLDDSDEAVTAALVAALRAWPGLDGLRVRFAQAHRWRFARVIAPLGEPALYDAARGLGVAGDGLLGPRIEAAWESGRALAARVIAASVSPSERR